jgi:hypothetical protein
MEPASLAPEPGAARPRCRPGANDRVDMQSRFAVVLMSVAGAAVLFSLGFALGLGILGPRSSVPHRQNAITAEPTKVSPPQTVGSAPAADDKPLTPVYPAQPAPPASSPVEPATQQAAGNAPQQAEQSEPQHSAQASSAVRHACDVAACSRAYRSFRESDCTYQPYSGPRRLCADPPLAMRGYHRDFRADGADDRVVPADVERGGLDDDDQ